MIAKLIPQILGENIANKKIDAETQVNKASEQAIYFFSTLQRLRIESDEKRLNRNPIKKIRKSLGSVTHRRVGSQSSFGSSSHRRTGSQSSVINISLKRINSQNSIGTGSQHSLNSIYPVGDYIGDDNDTVATQSSRGSRSAIWK